MAVALATVSSYVWLCGVALIAGIAWMSVVSSLNVSAQTAIPEWVRARALAVYSVALMGGMAGGAALWGIIATRLGTLDALWLAAGGLILGLGAALRYHLAAAEDLDLTPSQSWPAPPMALEPHLDDGPVLVVVEYSVNPDRARAFAEAIQKMEPVRRRDGAFRWGIFRDIAEPDRWLETFVVESWGEHLRQHERHTAEDRPVEDDVRSLVKENTTPSVSHYIWGRVPAENGPESASISEAGM
jgi:MFS family permease